MYIATIPYILKSEAAKCCSYVEGVIVSDETASYRLTHTELKRSGARMFVIVDLRVATIDDLETQEPNSPEYRRAAIAICAKFKIAAGKKYFKGEWPEEHDLSIDVIEYKEIDTDKRQPLSSQQRGKRQ